MSLVDTIDHLGQETASKVTGLWDATRNGLDHDTFVRRSAHHVNRANARATTTADQAVAADLRRQTGKPIRPAGIRPINDQTRLEGSIRKVAAERPKGATTPDDAHLSIRSRLGRLARNEPSTAAQNTTRAAMEHHQRFIHGWVRQLGGSNTCPLCVRWADGVVRSTKIHMNRHHNCRCMQRSISKKAAELNKAVIGNKERIGVLLAASPADEIALASLVGYGGSRGLRAVRASHFGPSIFDRINQFETNLGRSGIELVKGEYMVHGSGLLDALNVRVAADLDVVASPELYEQIAEAPGWRRVQAGVKKDVEILSNRELNVQVVRALPAQAEQLSLDVFPPAGQAELPFPRFRRRQITVDDLRINTVTLNGREFINPDLLKEMKTAALKEGAKVGKNIRDLGLLDGRLTWTEDVRRFGDLLNRSRLSTREERLTAAARHPTARFDREGALQRAQAEMRKRSAHRASRPIATVDERRALQKYGKHSFGLNRRLREGVHLSRFEADQVRSIDRALAKQYTPFTVKTYRGLRMTREEALDLYADKVGTVVRDKSFTSVGLRKSVAEKYAQDGVYLEIEVPAGTNGYYAPYRALTSQDLPEQVLNAFGEDELLLPREIPYHIKEIVEESDGTITIRAEVMPTSFPEPPLPGMNIEASAKIPDPTLSDLDARGRFPGSGLGATLTEQAAKAGAAISDELGALLDHVQLSARWAGDVILSGLAELKRVVVELLQRGVAATRELAGGLVDRFITQRLGPDFLSQLPGAFTQSLLKSFADPAGRLDFVERLLAGNIGPRSTPGDLWAFFKGNPDLARYLPDAIRAIPDAVRVASQPQVRTDLERIAEKLFGRGAGTRITDGLFERLRKDPKRLLQLFDDVSRSHPDVVAILRNYRRELAGVVVDSAKSRVVDLGETITQGTRDGISRLLRDLRRSERGAFSFPGGAEPGKRIAAARAKSVKVVRAAGEGPAMGPDLIPEANVAKTIARQAKVPGFEDITELLKGPEIVGHLRGKLHGLSSEFPVDDLPGLAELHGSLHHVPDPLRLGRGHSDLRAHPTSLSPRGVLDEIMRRQTDFIVRAAQRSMELSPQATELHATWYPFAHGWLNDLADTNAMRVTGQRDAAGRLLGTATGITRNGSYAATAALSPGADWAHNIAWAKRVIKAIGDDVTIERDWLAARYRLDVEAGRELGLGAATPRFRTELVGKRLSEIDDPREVAYALRGWHDHDSVMQLGGHAGFGNPANRARPQSLDNLEKAGRVLRDGSLENLDATLGGMKVRSFFNNLARPFDLEDLDVAVDTHHFGVANGHPWTTSNRFVASGSLNITETPGSAATGAEGTYPLIVEATRRATAILNARWGTSYLPDQIQSIVWEMHRADYPDFVRRGPGVARMNRDIDRARTARATGHITVEEERRRVDAARYRGGGPSDDEILEWFGADLAGMPRPNLVAMRAEKNRLRKAAEREAKRRQRSGQ